MYLFSSLGRDKRAEVCIWSKASFNLSATQRLGKRGGFHITDSSLWHGSIGGLEGRQAGRQSNCWAGWKGTVRDLRKWHGNWYREGNWEEAHVFFPRSPWGEACTWSEDRYQGWDVANALPYIPIKFLSLCSHLAYSPALASFWFIWLCFCGSSQQREALKSNRRTKARCARGAQWAPRLGWEVGTDTSVWPKDELHC